MIENPSPVRVTTKYTVESLRIGVYYEVLYVREFKYKFFPYREITLMNVPNKFPTFRLNYNPLGYHFEFVNLDDKDNDIVESKIIHPEIEGDVAARFADFIYKKYSGRATIEQVREEIIPFLADSLEKGFPSLVRLRLYKGEED